jgi:hypothetical protein
MSNSNHKYLYQKELDDYYRCLETINNNYNLLGNARYELSWHEQKLQEGQQLVKSFGFSDNEIKNLPTIQIYDQTTNRQRIENILASIKQNFAEMTGNKNFIDKSMNTIDLAKKTILIHQIS